MSNNLWNIWYEGIIVENFESITVSNNVISDAGKQSKELFAVSRPGILALNSESIHVTGNEVFNNPRDGIFISSHNSLIGGNKVINNTGNGIVINSSSYAEVLYNEVYRNSMYGISFISSTHGSTHTNNISGNLEGNAYDDQQSPQDANSWDDGISSGNGWGNYDGSGTYSIDGPANAIDHYPFQFQEPTESTASESTTNTSNTSVTIFLGSLSIFVTLVSVICIIIVSGLIIRFKLK